MIHIKNILIPTDFSECTLKAIQYGASLGCQYRAKVTILAVADDLVYDEVRATSISYPQDDVLENREKASLEKIDRIIATLKEEDKKLEVEKSACFGVPDQEIIKFAKENKIDLIVMGTHGNTGIKHLILGSTTEQVIRKGPCPVLAIRAELELAEEDDRKAKSTA